MASRRDDPDLEIPLAVEQAIREAVANGLAVALDQRGLLLAHDRMAAAEERTARRGARLLSELVGLAYSNADLPAATRETVTVEFESAQAADRVHAALAFGAATADVLASSATMVAQDPSVGLLCATFNLGIGLVDGLCDGQAESGLQLLELIAADDLADAANTPRARGWLQRRLPPNLAGDAAVAFTVDVVETFLLSIHTVHPGESGLALRRHVGDQLQAALDAERQSVRRAAGHFTHARLVDCSRLTSVVPFQIIETLTGADSADPQSSPGTLLGEAMWRIDDLVDLCEDARCGALNAILLHSGEALELLSDACRGRDARDIARQLMATIDIDGATAQATEKLRAGLHGGLARRSPADAELAADAFLQFIQRYAGIGAGERS